MQKFKILLYRLSCRQKSLLLFLTDTPFPLPKILSQWNFSAPYSHPVNSPILDYILEKKSSQIKEGIILYNNNFINSSFRCLMIVFFVV